MSEQQSRIPIAVRDRPAPGGYMAWPDYWAAQQMPWRTEPEIGEERQEYLTERRTVTPDIARGIYPFRDNDGGIRLSRADIEWLLATHESRGERGPVIWAHEKGKPDELHREGLDLRGANLAALDLRGLPLARLRGGLNAKEWEGTTSEQQDLAAVCLDGTHIEGARLEAAILRRVQMARAFARNASMERIDGYRARFQETSFYQTELGGSNLRAAHFEGANLLGASLWGADLRRTFFDVVTNLVDVSFGDMQRGFALIADARWDRVNLATVSWPRVSMLGDEQVARGVPRAERRKKSSPWLHTIEAGVRANRQLAIALRSQGLNEDADRFAYRAQVLQRMIFFQRRKLGAYLFSLLLATLAGYGYRLWRIVLAYGLIVALFAIGYFVSGVISSPEAFTWQQILPKAADALQISFNAIHGRVFFAQLGLDTVQSWMATAESIAGIVIEGVFVAMLVQRFFSR